MFDTDIPVATAPLFLLDYDGTLAPIVDDPLAAYPHPEVPELLRALDRRFPLWIVTGRYLADVSAFIDAPYRAIGLHGMQEGTLGGRVEDLITDEAKASLEQMRRRVPEIEGLHIEAKGPTFAVHYRHVENEEDAVAALETWLGGLPETLGIIRGKKVYEVRPRELTKGTAVARIAADLPDHTPIYIGDDVTDEDAFQALAALDRESITIKIGPGETSASYRLPGPDEVVAYLKRYTV